MDNYAADRRRLIGAGVLVAGAGLAACSTKAKSDSAALGWTATPEKLDSWLDKPGTRHRMVFDSLSGQGGADALGFANNFIHVNESDYALKPEQLGIVIVFRHMSTPYGYGQPVWAKYGKAFAAKMGLKDELAKRAATTNPLLARGGVGEPAPAGMEWADEDSLGDFSSKGVRFAVCALATRAIAGIIAGNAGNAAAIEAELRSNLVPGALLVPAGISAVNRAQEHGYALGYVG